MTENIGARLTELCNAQDLSLYLSEAQADSFPYAVYDADYTPYYDKDGPYKIIADVTVRAYSKDHQEAEDLAVAIDNVILENFASEEYTVRTMSQMKKDCLQETWSVSFQYRITQKRIISND